MAAKNEFYRVEQRLDQWAKWVSRGGDDLGYPPQTAESRMMSGGVSTGGYYSGPGSYPQEEETESLLLLMGKDKRHLQEALLLSYLTRGGYRAKAEKMGVGGSTFRNWCHQGLAWLSGALAAKGHPPGE